jgi:CO/xanthine dehydrogenase FAD-binding subunit
MKEFLYLSPQSLDEALVLLKSKPGTLPLAGGTDLLVGIMERHRSVEALLSLKRIPELHCCSSNGSLRIGSAVTAGQVARDENIRKNYTALAEGAGLIGSLQIQNMATIGGNVCNASPSADTAPALLVLGASAVIASADGERVVPMETFFVAPGKTVLKAGELLKEIVLPQPAARSGSFYLRHTPRARMDLAFVGVAAAITLDPNGRISEAKIALGAVAPTPMRAFTAEKALVGSLPADELFDEVGLIASKEAKPIDDLRASAEYRRHLVHILTGRALQQAFERARR